MTVPPRDKRGRGSILLSRDEARLLRVAADNIIGHGPDCEEYWPERCMKRSIKSAREIERVLKEHGVKLYAGEQL